ncbi:MAG: SEC-C domain-containing protein [Clostridiaceae bacterium]|nr:SEC-C domain-containing protein [Clostridiaceae bacterium]
MEQALLKFNQALILSTQFKYQLGIGCSLKDIGQVHFQNKSFQLALENFNENLIICTYIGDKSSIADAMKDIGLTLIAQRKFEEGIIYLNKSIVIYKEIGTGKSTDNYFALMEYIYSVQKNLEELKVVNSNLGRNDLCSCGSGKKYKKCCLSK